MRWLHYFAYGSNMLRERLHARAPSAEVLGIAQLNGRRLDFGKLGADSSGKCDVPVDQAGGACAWGVVYAIRRDELIGLDAIEGAPAHYTREPVTVDLNGAALKVETYVARRRGQRLVPFDWYHAVVLAGARQHGLPSAYVAWLEAHPCVPDPDPHRLVRRDAEAALGRCEVAVVRAASVARSA